MASYFGRQLILNFTSQMYIGPYFVKSTCIELFVCTSVAIADLEHKLKLEFDAQREEALSTIDLIAQNYVVV